MDNTALETKVLELVAKGQGKWSWYQLETRLSNMDVPREPSLIVVLKQLADRGLVKRGVIADSPHDRWQLTAKGARFLAEQAQRG